MSREDRWEYGSEFHWYNFPTTTVALERKEDLVPGSTCHYYSSGRAALLAILLQGKQDRGWKRVWVPTFYCPQIIPVFRRAELEVLFYEDLPTCSISDLYFENVRRGDVVVVVNYFGLRDSRWSSIAESVVGDVIEDHTHDPLGPWAEVSQAHYCFASLRKLLPVPDGGSVWSPRSLDLPNPVAPPQYEVVDAKLAAMLLKARYLDGANESKDTFRALQLRGEDGFDQLGLWALSEISKAMLSTLPWTYIRSVREERSAFFLSTFTDLSDVVMGPGRDSGCVPSGLIFLCKTIEQRKKLQSYLVQERIYPARLWQQEEISSSPRGVDFGERVLSLPCDFRYTEDDLARVATVAMRAID